MKSKRAMCSSDLGTTDIERFNLELYALLSKYSRKRKSKGSSVGNDWSVKREDITDIEWRFSLSR